MAGRISFMPEPGQSDPRRSVAIRVVRGSVAGRFRTKEPVTVGVPLPRGLSADTASWALTRLDGTPIPLQARPLDRWADGSVRWALVDFQATADEATEDLAELTFAGGRPARPDQHRRIATETASGVTADTGVLRLTLGAGPDSPIHDVSCSSRVVLDLSRSRLRVLDPEGRACRVRWQAAHAEENGPVRAVVCIAGKATGRGFSLDLVARLHVFVGSAAVRLELTVRNPRRARHPGGIWELGDPGSVLLREVALDLVRPASSPASRIEWSVEPGLAWRESSERVDVYQESSGGENWHSRSHVNRHGIIPLRFSGYELAADGRVSTGRRATPVVVTTDASVTLGATLRQFWENFPKALVATTEGLTVSLFPGRAPDLHELQGGEQKTHECWLLFGPDLVTARPLEWCRSPLVAHLSPEWCSESGAVPCLTPAASDPHAAYLALVNSAVEGNESFVAKRERADEYGWRNFGDIHADHEAANAANPADFVSHYNNQYDAVSGCAIHLLRTGDPRWWHWMDELARHVVDIDIYHTDQDKAAYNHGYFWHTSHYTDAGRSSHRAYPGAEGVFGGGPSNEHDYTTGLMLHHFLTGSPQSREAVLDLAQWVIDMDDGTKTVFRWMDRGPTGLASQTGSPLYHGPGRGAANSILTLLNAQTLTGDRRYLAKAEQLIRRCIHPDTDIAALDLLDAERKWFYTVFLQVLGKYLRHKADVGELDSAYAYGRASLLHFVRWMVVHEYPYLDRPEILEYPNETWAAQDMRKCDVFMHAAMHSDGTERQRFEERAGFFFEYSVRTLRSMPSHALTRPTVLMLLFGWQHAFVAQHPELSMPAPAAEPMSFGDPEPFVPQKVRALRRARLVVVAVAALGLVAAAVAVAIRFG